MAYLCSSSLRIGELNISCLTENLLAEFLDGALPAEAHLGLHRHIRICVECRELVASLARAKLPTGQMLDSAEASGVRAIVLSWSSQFTRLEPLANWEPPAQIEEYRIEKVLGSGAMGRVYLGHDTRLDRPVAIKFLASIEPDAAACERFLIEARALGRLQHPNVVICYRVGEAAGRPYLVSEYVSGISLDRLPKPIGWEQALAIGIGLARGLEAAHAHGVLHRDIKPANVVLSDEANAKLLDFGLAKLMPNPLGMPTESASTAVPRHGNRLQSDAVLGLKLGASLHQTNANAIVGTPIYMAPEIWRGDGATTRSDVYSLGMLLYEISFGRPPYHSPTLATLRETVLTNEHITINALDGRMHPQFAAVITRCLSHKPNERFADGGELRAALEAISLVRRHRSVPRRLGIVMAAVVILFVIGGSAVWLSDITKALFPGTLSQTTVVPRMLSRSQFRVTLQSPPSNQAASMSGEREIGITVAGLPADVVDLRITLEIDGQRKRVWRPAGANLRPLNLALPPDSSGQRLKVEILAYDEHCSVAVGRGAVEWHTADPRQLSGTFENCSGCWCAEHPPVGHRHIGVWAASEDAAWLVGENAPIQRYDGLSWLDETPGQAHHLITVWGFGPDQLWAVGGCGNPKKSCPYPPGQQSNIVMRRENGAWTKDASFGDGLGQFLVVWATDEQNVWAAGSQGPTKMTRGIIAHRDQHGWKELPEGPSMGTSLHGIWGATQADVWLVGEQSKEAVIWRYSGGTLSSWSPVSLPKTLGTLPTLWGVWGTASDNVWAIGNRGVILRWNGTAWAIAPSPFNIEHHPDLANLWVQNPDAMWIVGDNGTLLRWHPAANRWAPVPISVPFCEKATGSLYGIWSGGKDVWVTGECGTVYHYRSK